MGAFQAQLIDRFDAEFQQLTRAAAAHVFEHGLASVSDVVRRADERARSDHGAVGDEADRATSTRLRLPQQRLAATGFLQAEAELGAERYFPRTRAWAASALQAARHGKQK
ncbi:MAG: hypothetical protein H6708_22365 [Kofleriaceae bacterium]|nr:hypothetical protein [Myxococcales bacterium]MCB9563151.1 hypothetical protein [Kofleriaceae bacterium]